MPHHPHLRRSLLACWALAACLLAVLPVSAPVRAAGPELSAEPGALALTLPLGAAETRTFMITNHGAAAVAPSAFEALPAYPAAQAPRAVGPRSVALPRQAERIDPQLARELAAPAARADFIIYLRDQADLSAAYAIRDWDARGAYVYQALRAHAARSQAGLLAVLAGRGLAARSFWVANAVLVRGTLADAQALAVRGEVALVRANHTGALPAGQPGGPANNGICSPQQTEGTVCWNIRQIGADRAWRDFGVTGRGIVVANIDTGVRFDHPALVRQYRGYRGDDPPDHNYNWFDPKLLTRAPNDPNGHGTHTMGTMVAAGAGTTAQPAVGVAPEARWIAAQGCASVSCSDADLIDAAQWLLAPTALDGRDPRPDLRPMIVNNSWADGGGQNWYAGYVAAWRAAGIFPVFAAGNTGSACGSVGSPADYPDALGVGATDSRDIVALFSARGPTADGRRKPDLVAPGGNPGILSAGPGEGADYRVLQGTSMAAPHVAGLVALLWQANPNLIGDYEATRALLQASARARSDTSCGDAPGVPNNVYGYGRVDAYAAVQRARVDVPWLSVVAAPGRLAPNSSGSLQLRLDAARVPAPGSYRARVQLFAELTAAPSNIDITLTVKPTGAQATITGRVISDDTGQPLAASVKVRGGQPVAAGPGGRFVLVLAPGAYQLEVSAPSYVRAEQAITVGGDMRLPDVRLQPDYARLALAPTSLSATLEFGQKRAVQLSLANNGPRPLHYTARVLPDEFAALRSDEPGGPAYAWVSLPRSATVLALGTRPFSDAVPIGFEFPLYSYTFTETLVSADGFLAFSEPPAPYQAPVTGCFPNTAFLFYEIAPFRTDIDLARGGAIRYATIEQGRTFVVSYENVRLAAGGGSYSFQVLLHHDGRIVYQYRDLPSVPAALAVGLQRTDLEYQELGCGAGAPIGPGLAIELRPQTAPKEWLSLARASGTIAPGGRQTVGVALRWALAPFSPQRARIEITTNDPFHRRVLLPVLLELRPAQHSWLMPLISQPLW